MTEDRLIGWLRRRAGAAGRAIGDDAALLEAGGPLAVTVDHQISGVHFPDGLDPRRVARRLVAVNLSDLAAVGGRPRHALVAVAAPPRYDLRRFLAALVDELRRWQVDLVGGDLARADRFGASLTVLGDRPARGRWVRRGDARAGDRLWIGGSVGESAAGRLLLRRSAEADPRTLELPHELARPRATARAARRAIRRHLAPAPQLALGRWLGGRRRAAAIDLSDGLALDLHRLCAASAVGAVVEASSLPLPERLDALAACLGRRPLELALSGGEDYVLLFALPPRLRPPLSFGCRAIGEIVGGRRIALRRGGRLEPLAAAGWDHLAGERSPPSGAGSSPASAS